MALNAASTSTPPAEEDVVIAGQAGPLPLKLGEIGYREADEDLERGVVEEGDVVENLPARHPADQATNEGSGAADTEVPLTPAAATPDDVVSTRPSNKQSPRRCKALGGVTITTLAAFVAQILALGGTIAAWVLAAKRLSSTGGSLSSSSPSTSVFIFVVFVIVTLFELILLDRRIFRIRAERYSYLHPGELLPTTNASMGLAPWHRPPLPTYAAALAAGDVRGTGDVEDIAISIPPPPAYGNTRDSRMLLQGFLRNSLRAQRPVSQHTQTSECEGERPLSYASHDAQWQEIQDAERAINLEETLSQLEEGRRRRSDSTEAGIQA